MQRRGLCCFGTMWKQWPSLDLTEVFYLVCGSLLRVPATRPLVPFNSCQTTQNISLSEPVNQGATCSGSDSLTLADSDANGSVVLGPFTYLIVQIQDL